jgi:peroxiredoxin
LHIAFQAIGVDLDLVEKGLGIRSRRYAMLVDNGTVSRCALHGH